MAEQKRLGYRQLAVIDDLFTGELDQQQILRKHRIKPQTFDKWLDDEGFLVELDKRAQWLCRQGEFIIVRNKSLAAFRLVGLTNSESQETARKACLDVINLANPASRAGGGSGEESPRRAEHTDALSSETAGKLLAVLAEEKAAD